MEAFISDRIIAIYCLCDDLLKALHHHKDPQRQMSDAKVITTAITAALFFHGNFETARAYLKDNGMIPSMLSKSRFHRRLHRIRDLFLTLFSTLGEIWKQLNADSIYIIDSFPIPVCDNYRIRRCRLYRSPEYRDYIASKRRYFYGLKIHVLATANGEPVEVFLTPGSASDVACLEGFQWDLPPGATVYVDRGYNDAAFEAVAAQDGEFAVQPMRQANMKNNFHPGFVICNKFIASGSRR
ncbi:IS982 family transposase [Thermoflexus sp.]|uniref:IS982 family transposase n=1 Tax=Thermoflexus sp. TaxID=1969742 RepID=UPI0035E45DCC